VNRPLVHVVGLGPGGPDLVTAGTLELVRSVPRRHLRTARHPAATVLEGAPTFDHLYDTGETIEDVYRSIVEALVDDAAEHGEVLYAVPGSPVVAEHTVELLLADARIRASVHPAMSFLDLTWARLGIDPVEQGVRLVDGHRFATEAAGERGPLLVAQCDHRFVLSDIKLSVEQPPDVAVTVLQRLGLPDERVVEVDWSDMDRVLEPDHLTSLWIPRLGEPVAGEFVRLEQLMARLRVEDPWKAAQTHESLKRFLLEESYEVFEAVDDYDPDTGAGSDELCAELGDLLYQVVFHAAIAREAGWFTLADVANAIHDKLVRRHGHVFDTDGGGSPAIEELVSAWEADKRIEMGRSSIMDGIPAALPALARASKVLKKAEALDLGAAGGGSPEAIDATALGDALFVLVERAHGAGLDPEDALRRATDRRIEHIRRNETGA
jgi:tetrapyrrole methylase family protein / MazG family protein